MWKNNQSNNHFRVRMKRRRCLMHWIMCTIKYAQFEYVYKQWPLQVMAWLYLLVKGPALLVFSIKPTTTAMLFIFKPGLVLAACVSSPKHMIIYATHLCSGYLKLHAKMASLKAVLCVGGCGPQHNRLWQKRLTDFDPSSSNLRGLNRFLKAMSLPKLTTVDVLHTAAHNERFTSIDLKGTYLHVPITSQH